MPGEDGFRFARQFRLTKTDEFSSVFGFRRAIRGQLLMLHYQPRTEAAATPRLGLVIGKKQLKKAVDRNCVKRLIREHFRLHRNSLPACDLILRSAVKMAPVDRSQVRRDLEQLFQRLIRQSRRENKPA